MEVLSGEEDSQSIALGLSPDLSLGLADVPAAEFIYCHSSLAIRANETSLFVVVADRSPPVCFTDSTVHEKFRIEFTCQAVRLLSHSRHP